LRKSCALLIGAGLLLTVGSSLASAHSAAVKAACKTDYYKFCPNYKLDTAQIKACMRSAGGNLSQRCIDALADAGEISRKYHSSNRKK
jgi:hypothetical protein